jgi:hypothetical protein
LLEIPENFSVQIGKSDIFYKLFGEKKLFSSLPSILKLAIFDLLFIILRRSIYDIARFRCCERKQTGAVRLLLDLIHSGFEQDVLVIQRIVRLVGIMCVSGVSTQDLKAFLKLLRKPSPYSMSLLQALKTMNRGEDGIVKASPSSFLNFGGDDKALLIEPYQFPFEKEYQICTWIRVENQSNSNQKQHLISLLNGSIGVDIFIEREMLHVLVANATSEVSAVECGVYALTPGVWYHICVTHSKPRMSLFPKYELVVHIDHQVVFQNTLRFPNASAIGLMTSASLGRGF